MLAKVMPLFPAFMLRRRGEEATKIVKAAMESLGADLRHAAQAIEDGDLELADFAWEDEVSHARAALRPKSD